MSEKKSNKNLQEGILSFKYLINLKPLKLFKTILIQKFFISLKKKKKKIKYNKPDYFFTSGLFCYLILKIKLKTIFKENSSLFFFFNYFIFQKGN